MDVETTSENEAEFRKHRADVFLRFLRIAKNIEALGDKKVTEIFSSEENKRELIENLTPEQFLQLLNGLNGILRGKSRKDWIADGETVELRGDNFYNSTVYLPPDQEDKPELLAEVLDAAKKMNSQRKSLSDIALMVTASLNAIHYFIDGNGRTSRIIYFLFAQTGVQNSKDQLRDLMVSGGGDEGTNPDPGLISRLVTSILEKEMKTGWSFCLSHEGDETTEMISDFFYDGSRSELKFHKEVQDDQKEQFLKLLKDEPKYLHLAVVKFLKEHPNKKLPIKKFPNFSRIVLDADDSLETLDNNDISEILKNYKLFKKKYVEKLIDCLANPEKVDYQIENEGEGGTTIKDRFEIEIQRKRQFIAKLILEIKNRKAEEKALEDAGKAKEAEIKKHFEAGEGKRKIFPAHEIESFRAVHQTVFEMSQIVSSETSEGKKELLIKSLFSLAKKLGFSESLDQISAYIEAKGEDLLKFTDHFVTTDKTIGLLEESRIFTYKITTSNDFETPFSDQKNLKGSRLVRFLDDLFSRSVYFVSPSGLSLRLKLFEAKSANFSEVVQPVMEQIFYSDHIVDYTDREVVVVSGSSPELRKHVFEIASSDFSKMVSAKKEITEPMESGVRTISDEEKVYVYLPKGSLLHSGWSVVGIENL